MEPVFLYPLVDQLTVFGLVSALKMLNNILLSYGKIDLINIEENNVNMMGPYNPPPEDPHEMLDNLHIIIQGIQTQSYKLEGLAQSNELLTIPNT